MRESEGLLDRRYALSVRVVERGNGFVAEPLGYPERLFAIAYTVPAITIIALILYQTWPGNAWDFVPMAVAVTAAIAFFVLGFFGVSLFWGMLNESYTASGIFFAADITNQILHLSRINASIPKSEMVEFRLYTQWRTWETRDAGGTDHSSMWLAEVRVVTSHSEAVVVTAANVRVVHALGERLATTFGVPLVIEDATLG